jgi:hypothetical protein
MGVALAGGSSEGEVTTGAGGDAGGGVWPCSGCGLGNCGVLHAAKIPTIAATTAQLANLIPRGASWFFSERYVMGLILLEALGALLLLVLIVWWTMFSGRKKGELPGKDDQA